MLLSMHERERERERIVGLASQHPHVLNLLGEYGGEI